MEAIEISLTYSTHFLAYLFHTLSFAQKRRGNFTFIISLCYTFHHYGISHGVLGGLASVTVKPSDYYAKRHLTSALKELP